MRWLGGGSGVQGFAGVAKAVKQRSRHVHNIDDVWVIKQFSTFSKLLVQYCDRAKK